MKRITFCLLILILVFSVSACRSNNTKGQSDNNSDNEQQTLLASENNEDNGSENKTDKTNSDNNTVVVPSVVGMNVDEATTKLEGMGLVVETEIEHLIYKDKNNTSLGYYDEGYVLEQDSKAGTVMVKGSTVKLIYNSNTSQFEYTMNEDGTITLTDIRATYCPNKIFQIPQEYDGRVVTAVNSTLIKNFNELFPQITIQIPKETIINGETTVSVEYY